MVVPKSTASYSEGTPKRGISVCRERPAPRQREERRESDFLAYKDHDGLYADFHSCRHFFIARLERAGIRPKVTQTLARHSEIRLTLQTHTHVELHDQTAAIRALPGPGRADNRQKEAMPSVG